MIERSKYYLLFFAATVVYIIGLFVKVMDVDAAQYASISAEMLRTHHYLEVFDRGHNYLDKPPLLFWLNVLSFKIFGVGTVSYKLPSFLATLLGVYSTFRLAKYLYDEETGWLAALVLYTSQAFFLFNNDVRTDTLLTAFVIFSCWQLVVFSESKKNLNLVLGFAGVSLAMMSKGPIGAVVPASALFVHFVMKREWSKFFRWQWIAGLFITFILLLPMLAGLYQQYGEEGPKFFLWTQSFGRITGENVWKNDTGYFYFVHVLGWSFLPWTIIVIAAFIFSVIKIFRKRFAADALSEYYTLGGFLFPFIALSFSHYKLPHYIFVLYPLAAIFTAAYITKAAVESQVVQRLLRSIQLIVSVVILIVAVFICTEWFPASSFLIWLPVAAGVAVFFWWMIKAESKIAGIILPSAVAAITVNFLLAAQAYPALLKYQSGSELAAIANEKQIPKDQLYACDYTNYGLDFYLGTYPVQLSLQQVQDSVAAQKHFWLFGNDKVLQLVNKNNLPVKNVFTVSNFHITTLNTKFLNPGTRDSTLSKAYLLQF